MKYRNEINGLRAIAIIPVVLFHANVPFFSGGYVGVDIFFVISGYLITTTIINDLEQQKFSVIRFYERRSRRLLPLLLLVLSVVYIFSYFYNLPGVHKIVGQYVTASIIFSSNFLLYFKSGDYFGIDPQINPLYHTWSLAVEEQYYIVFPLLLILLRKCTKKTIFFSLFLIFLISLTHAHLDVKKTQSASFFLITTRAWEILLGSFCALFISSNNIEKYHILNQITSLIGLLLIGFSIFFFDPFTPNPSLFTLIPATGSALVIIFAKNYTFVKKMLCFKIFVITGLISYSAYLWHIPIFTIFNQILQFSSEATSNLYKVVPILVIFVLSLFSWRFVEQPFRSKSIISTKVFLVFSLSSCFVLSVLGIIGHLNGGYPERNKLFLKLKQNNGFGLHCNGNFSLSKKCTSKEPVEVAVLGNSYAMQFVNAVAQYYDKGVLQLTRDSCKLGYKDQTNDLKRSHCLRFYKKAINTINTNPNIKIVFLSSTFDEILNEKESMFLTNLLIKLEGKQLIVLGPTPIAPFNIGDCLKDKFLNPFNDSLSVNCNFFVGEEHKRKISLLFDRISRRPNLIFIDITPFICPDNVCKMEPEAEIFMYTDRGHLSYEGSIRVVGLLSGSNLIPIRDK